MGFFSDLKDKIGTPTLSPTTNIGNFLGDTLRDESEDRAQETIDQAQEGVDLKRDQFNLLREDSRPLRELRNDNINRLLRISGIGEQQNIDDFRASPEFTTVRDAALRVQGSNSGQNRELAERANQLGSGEFSNFHNRIFNTAGFSSSGLNNTNKLLQANVDAQANLLNNAGAQAASNIMSASNAKNSAASGIGGIFAALCDARLKKNIKRIGSYHSGLGKYAWEWTEKAKELVGNQPNIGPMAHEVFDVMPENVGEYKGYLQIKDMRLINGY